MSRETREFERQQRHGRMQVVKSFEAMNADTPKSFQHNGGACVKCGCTQHVLAFCDGKAYRPIPGCEIDGDHIHRACDACKFVWVERTLEHTIAFEEKGSLKVENEVAAALCAAVMHTHGLRLPMSLLQTYMGWTLQMRRDFETGTMMIDAESPKQEEA